MKIFAQENKENLKGGNTYHNKFLAKKKKGKEGQFSLADLKKEIEIGEGLGATAKELENKVKIMEKKYSKIEQFYSPKASSTFRTQNKHHFKHSYTSDNLQIQFFVSPKNPKNQKNNFCKDTPLSPSYSSLFKSRKNSAPIIKHKKQKSAYVTSQKQQLKKSPSSIKKSFIFKGLQEKEKIGDLEAKVFSQKKTIDMLISRLGQQSQVSKIGTIVDEIIALENENFILKQNC